MEFPYGQYAEAARQGYARENYNPLTEALVGVAPVVSKAIDAKTEARKEALKDYFKNNIVYDTNTGQPATPNILAKVYQGEKLPTGYAIKPLQKQSLDDIRESARARAEGALAGSKGQGVVDKTTFEAENKLRDDYRKDIGTYTSARDSFNRIKTSANTKTAAGDLSMLYAYMKMLDPTSVVRESEFAQAAKAGSYGERLKGAVKTVLTGEKLSDNIRNDFYKESQKLYNSQEEQYNKIKNDYTKRAKSYGLDANRIMTDYSIVDNPDINTANNYVFDTEEEANSANIPIGSVVTIGGVEGTWGE